MFRLFEKLLPPYPEAEPALPPKGFFAFVWACTTGLRGYIASLAVLSAVIAAYEAFLFAMLGHVVDWLGRVQPASLWAEQGPMLRLLGAVLLASTLVIALQTIVKHQTLAINFPLRLRWNFHRLMLGQSMAFYSDEFDAAHYTGDIDTRRTPLWLMTGDYDYSATPADTRKVAAAVPGAQFMQLDGFGHFPMTEDPQRLLAHFRPAADALRATIAP